MGDDKEAAEPSRRNHENPRGWCAAKADDKKTIRNRNPALVNHLPKRVTHLPGGTGDNMM